MCKGYTFIEIYAIALKHMFYKLIINQQFKITKSHFEHKKFKM